MIIDNCQWSNNGGKHGLINKATRGAKMFKTMSAFRNQKIFISKALLLYYRLKCVKIASKMKGYQYTGRTQYLEHSMYVLLRQIPGGLVFQFQVSVAHSLSIECVANMN